MKFSGSSPTKNLNVAGDIVSLGGTFVITVPDGISTVSLQLTGTWTGQLEFEGSVDGTNYQSVEASNGTATVNAATGNDIYILPGAGYTKIRVRASSWTSGRATITFLASTGPATSILTGAIPAGTNIIGKVGIDQTTAGTTNAVAVTAVKTIQTELLTITAVAANAQQKSSELSLTGIKKCTIFIDHGRTAVTAFVVAGTEYRIEASQKASGDDTWVPLASVVCDITAAVAIVMDNAEAAGATRIECTAVVPTKGDWVYFKNATIANSEWAKVILVDAGVGTEYFDILDGLAKAQAAITMYNKAERFALTLDVEAFTRLRVVVNNNNGTTNVAVDSRIAAITEA